MAVIWYQGWILIIFVYGFSQTRQRKLHSTTESPPPNTKALDELATFPAENLDTDFSNLTHLESAKFTSERSVVLTKKTLPNITISKCLLLQKSNISFVKPYTFDGLDFVVELNLANNEIQKINNETLVGLQSLQVLNFSGNMIKELSQATFQALSKLKILDLSSNCIQHIAHKALQGLFSLEKLFLKDNSLSNLQQYVFLSLQSLSSLDLSGNVIKHLNNQAFIGLSNLTILSLENNSIINVNSEALKPLIQLKRLSLSKNLIKKLDCYTFKYLKKLQTLVLTEMKYLNILCQNAFEGLINLKTLNMSACSKLNHIPKNIFLPLTSLQIMDLRHNNISMILNNTFHINVLQSLYLQGNPLICNCATKWILFNIQNNSAWPKIENANETYCLYLNNRSQHLFLELSEEDLVCDMVQIGNYTQHRQFKIGSSASLRCPATGDPLPTITWITPHKQQFSIPKQYAELLNDFPSPDDVEPGGWFHSDHFWHKSTHYYSHLNISNRICVLNDGSLYVDYVLRSDAGNYTCIAENPLGNTSIVITFNLDYSIMQDIKILSAIVGVATACAFFVINLIIAGIREAMNKCVNQRKREAIRKLIENLEAYKSAQTARLKENYNLQIGKVREQYHHQIERVRENYNSQMARIKENCSHQVERIRDNYTYQLGRIKGYSSHQIIQLRERYTQQILKIRGYGSLQMERFRENYKLQQQHLLKILETINMENCRGVIESECMRTDSMLFDTDFHVDTEIHIEQSLPIVTDSSSNSEYVTASSSDASPEGSQVNLQYFPSTSKINDHCNCELDEDNEQTDSLGNSYQKNLNLQLEVAKFTIGDSQVHCVIDIQDSLKA